MKPTLVLVIAIGLAACVQGPETVFVPPVVINGSHGVVAGSTLALTARTLGADDSGYTWAVLDAEVATVDANGLVTAMAPGETTVTATGNDTGSVGHHALVVAEELPAEVTITGSGHVVVITSTLALTAATANGNDTAYTWASEDPAVVSVDGTGLVTGVGLGETSVTATGDASGAVGRFGIVVTPSLSSGVPNYAAWSGSAHADKSAPAFSSWNNEDPPVVPADCARCHSNGGFQDYIGEDGSAVGTVEKAPTIGSTVECQTCHNATTAKMTSVTFPSGVTVGNLGSEARCMTCHQGRSSTDAVNAGIAGAATLDDDTVGAALATLALTNNVHNDAAGAVLLAGRVRGGYQYAGAAYDDRFRHVEGLDTCVGCHDPHSLVVRTERCAECHQGATNVETARNIRMMSSVAQDYDGDGNTSEGIFYEIAGLRERLLAAIQAYTKADSELGAICYLATTSPFWFKDTDGDGTCSTAEATFGNRFASWTPRLVRAGYNYYLSVRDQAAFAHNAKYMIQLLFDATADLAGSLAQPALLGESVRNDVGHFDGSTAVSHAWADGAEVGTSCSKCHGGAKGFRFFAEYGKPIPVSGVSNGLQCATCHATLGGTVDLVKVASVTFPSGVTVTSADPMTNLCSTCHSGNESRSTIDQAIASGTLAFRDVHYLPAAAVRQGTAARVGYEYDGKQYAGPKTTHMGGNECASCHNATTTKHTFRVADNFAACQTCHSVEAGLEDIRNGWTHGADYDGNGVSSGTLESELDGLAAALLARIQLVAGAATGTSVCYDRSIAPYFFIDTNDSGTCDGAAEAMSANAFDAWTPALLKAAHNFRLADGDAGAWAHNFDYVGQLLYDSLADLGDPMFQFVRP